MSIFFFILDGVIALGVITLLKLSGLQHEMRALRGRLTASILQLYIEFHFSFYLMVQTRSEYLHQPFLFLDVTCPYVCAGVLFIWYAAISFLFAVSFKFKR